LTEELLQKYGPFIATLTLIPSSGGRFEVTIDEELVYSKKTTGRHAEPGEVARLFEEKTGVEAISIE
jgi:selenoprotein W-related protein